MVRGVFSVRKASPQSSRSILDGRQNETVKAGHGIGIAQNPGRGVEAQNFQSGTTERLICICHRARAMWAIATLDDEEGK